MRCVLFSLEIFLNFGFRFVFSCDYFVFKSILTVISETFYYLPLPSMIYQFFSVSFNNTDR